MRVYFACMAAFAVREAAARDAKKKGRRARNGVRYTLHELSTITGMKERAVARELRLLKKERLLTWSEDSLCFNLTPVGGPEAIVTALSGKRPIRRPIPVPRTVLRFVASSRRGSVAKTALACVVRGLSIDRHDGSIRSAGTVKASWIADVFGLSLRSVKSARRTLIESGLITKDTDSFQRKLNRDGAYFRINLEWSQERKLAPPPSKNRVVFAPPIKYNKTSYEFKNQRARVGAPKMPGVCNVNKSRKESGPNLKNVRREDLKSYPRLRILFEQAVETGWLQASEASFLNWVAAAVRANTVAARDPVRVFISIVRSARWELITQAQEDRARAAIRHYRDSENVPRFSRNE